MTEPIVLMHVQRPLTATPIPAVPPTLTVVTQPAGAQVSVNGERIGAAPVMKSLPRGGQYTLRVETPGCAPVERPFTALDGYGLQVTINLPPGAREVTASVGGGNSDWYARAQEAESRQQWEVADLRLRRGKTREAIGTLVEMVNQAPSPRAYSLLSRAYSLLAAKEGGADPGKGGKSETKRKKGGLFGSILGKKGEKREDRSSEPAGYVVPQDAATAAVLALRAANEAVKQAPAAGDAQSALGFAQIATDRDGKNKDEALAAFGKAVLLEPQNAAQQYGMGYGIRTYAQRIADEAARKSELQRAVATLKQALDLRPDYYEAHRELAFCYHLLDDLPARIRAGEREPRRRDR